MTSENFRSLAALLVKRAALAPSSHNTQPWRFRISDAAIDLLADRKRALPINDPADRELTVSCGCALFNLRAAAAEMGIGVGVTLRPDPTEPDWLARVEPDPLSGSYPDVRLARAIGERHTYRKQFAVKLASADTLAALNDAAEAEGATLRLVHATPERRALAALVAEGDAIQWSDPAWRRELAAWMRARGAGDGLPVARLAGPVTRLIIRTFDMGRSIGAKDSRLVESSPLLLVLRTDQDNRRDWLLAGQALQRVLLTANTRGLQASFLNQPIQVESLRPRLRKLVGGGFPQIVLRLGYPSAAVSAAPRRSVEDVLVRNKRALVHSAV